jgi:hypothetical protein
MDKDEILKKGSVEVHARVSGIRQLHVLKVKWEKTVWGMVPYLIGEHPIPANELIRLAEELKLPIKCRGMVVFPRGKAPQDFAVKEEEKKEKGTKPTRKKALAHDKVMNGGGDKEDKESGKESGGEGDEKEEKEAKDSGDSKEEVEEAKESKEEGSDEETGGESEEKSEEAGAEANEEAPEDKNVEEGESENGESEKQEGDGEEKAVSTQEDNETGSESKDEKGKKKAFSDVLSEGILR